MTDHQSLIGVGEAITTEAGMIDISMSVDARTPSWDDRFPVTPTWHSRLDGGGRTTNSSWLLHSHTGTHVDAPIHHLPGGGDTGTLSLADTVGPCQVLDLTDAPGHIGAAELRAQDIRAGMRVLLKTRNSIEDLASRERFDPAFTGLAEDGARYLVERGVRLIGVDYLSVEPYGSPGFATHRVLLGADVVVLEGLVLAHVDAGEYLLCFLPIALTHSEAAPGRAVLFRQNVRGIV